jgi:hypothetical protein
MVKHAMDGQTARECWGISFDPWPQRHLTWPDTRDKSAPKRTSPTVQRKFDNICTYTPEHLEPHVLAIVCLMLRAGSTGACVGQT